MGDARPRTSSEALPWHDPSVFEPEAREHDLGEGLRLQHITATTLVGRYTDYEGRTRAGIYDLKDGDWVLRRGSQVTAPAGRTVLYDAGVLHIVDLRGSSIASSR